MMEGSPDKREPAAISKLLWTRFALRHSRQEPGTTALLVGILALGVAVFLAVRLANKAAVTGFAFFTESVAGESDMMLRAPAGDLDIRILRELRLAAGADPVAIFPVLEVSAADGKNPEASMFTMVGTDLVVLQNSAAFGGGESDGAGLSNDEETLGRNDVVFVGEAFGREQEVVAGDTFEVIVDDQSVSVTISAVLPDDPNKPAVPGNLMLMDLPGLQQLTGKSDVLSRIEFRIPPGENRESVLIRTREVFSALAAERKLILQTPEDRKSSVTTMSAAFRMNLTILSGLALIVGIYLILQAMEAAVVKRRSEIAVMRSLGVTPAQIRRAWLLESLVLGIVASGLGVILGWGLAQGLVGGIARTVNTIYYQTTTDVVSLEPGEIVFALIFGTVASVVAGFVPAREAASTPPAQSMRQGVQGGGLAILRKIPLGIALVIGGFICAWFPPVVTAAGTSVPLGGYFAAVAFVAGFSILIGLLFPLIARLVRGGKSDPLRGYAASQLQRPEGRHRLTAAGLAVAIGMSAAMGILVASFENTLTSWIGQLLKADVYVAAAGTSSVANGNTISAETWQGIEALPGVSGMDKLRRYTITMGGREVFLGGSDYNNDPERHLQLIWLDAPEKSGPDALESRKGDIPSAWISEPFARRFDVGKGDRVSFPTPAGEMSAEVTGIYADYGNESGTLLLSRRYTSQWFDDDAVSQIAVYVEDGADSDEVLEDLQRAYPALVSRTNASLRSESLRIFHQTFAVTYALEAIAVIIAVAGLGLALTGLLLERRAELETLRAMGATRGNIAYSAMWEGIGLASVGLAGGFVMSLLLGWVLIFVINPQSFGWTLDYRIPWLSFAGLAVVTIAVAALVAWFLGQRNANLQSDQEE